ncbi:MAG: hypothetical protein FWE50_02560 [Alphaproteobacteria bacterium]|nr:hypothetical protein [Alphaproteobacteria bacterium]
MKKLKLFLFLAFGFWLLAFSAQAETNLPSPGEIGNYGLWATEHNQELLTNNLFDDLQEFQGDAQKAGGKDYVPIEARVGKVFVSALDMIGKALADSLFYFVQILLVALLAFWILFETYNMMQGDRDVKKLAKEIATKVVFVSIWLWVLSNNPGEIFMTIFGPIITAGAYMSNLILNSITGAASADTCEAIKDFIGNTGNSIVSSSHTAELICLPTRLSGFFYKCVGIGFKWMGYGIGHSALTFVAGAVFVVIFAINIWKFALLAFGVIADLFLAILLLPFTAITECFGKGTNYKGIPGDIFKAFAGIFKYAGLSEQIQRFIRAIIYFIVLAIVAAIGAALLGGVVGASLDAATPSVKTIDGFMPVLIVGCLVAYLVNKAADIATSLGGKIDDSFGKTVGEDLKKAWKATTKQVSDWRKIFQEKKNK